MFEPIYINIELLLPHLFKFYTFKRGLFKCNEELLNRQFLVKYGLRDNWINFLNECNHFQLSFYWIHEFAVLWK